MAAPRPSLEGIKWDDEVPASPTIAAPAGPSLAGIVWDDERNQPAPFNQPQAPLGATYETPTGQPTADMGYAPKPVEGSGAGFVANLKANIPTDRETRRRIIEESTGQPAGYVNGRIATKNPDGSLEYSDAGLGSKTGAALANLPELVGGALGSFVSPIAGTALGATAGKAIKQIGSAVVLDEPQTMGGNAMGLAQEAVLNAATAGLVKGGSALYNRNAIKNADKFDIAGTKNTIEEIERSTGIRLDFAQAGDNPQLRAFKKWASKFPGEASEIVQALDRGQADQVATAIEKRLMDPLSGSSDRMALASSGIGAAKSALELAKRKRMADTREIYAEAEKVVLGGAATNALKADPYLKGQLDSVLNSPLYRREFEELGLMPAASESRAVTTRALDPNYRTGVNMNALLGRADPAPLPPGSSGSLGAQLAGRPVAQAPGATTPAGSVGPLRQDSRDFGTADRSIKAWDQVLRNLQDQAQAAKAAGEANKARLLSQKMTKLEETLRGASPEYGAARDAWKASSQALVEPLEKGLVGALAKIEGPDAANAAAVALDDVLADPRATALLRKQITTSSGDQAWFDFVKNGMAKQIDKAFKETQGGDVTNVAGKVRQALIGTPQRKRSMEVALSGSQVQAFDDLMGAFQLIARDARSRGGSDTAFNQIMTEQQKGGLLTSGVRMATGPFRAVRQNVEQRMVANNAMAFAEALTDPAKLSKLRELRKLPRSTERAAAMISVLGLGQTAVEPVADEILNPAPRNQLPAARQPAPIAP